jgi:aminoglycoside phosphotransferase (APT) family kinase protein
MTVTCGLRADVLGACPQFVDVLAIASYRPGYLPYPARLTVQLADGGSRTCVLKASKDTATIEREALALGALEDLAFPAPRILGNGTLRDDAGVPMAFLVLSKLSGEPLPWIALSDLTTAYRTCQMVGRAIDALHKLTPHLLSHPLAAMLPSITLAGELETIVERGGPWLSEPGFARALELLPARLPRHAAPLVFSNGDYNPLNFMTDGSTVTGWLDFEHATFEDPLIGLAKFLLWADDEFGWAAGAKAGLVERYLYEHGIAPEAFWVRLVLRGLWHLQGADPGNPPPYMQKVIASAMERLIATS